MVSELRKARQYVPVLMLTARGRPEDVLKGFSAGADDYLPKPTELAILLARVGSLLRRTSWSQAHRHDQYTFSGRTIDFDTLELTVGERVLKLTLMEANLLKYLIAHEGKAVSRKAMLEHVWELREDTDTRAIDNFVVRLRRYLEKEPAPAAAPAHGSWRRLSIRGQSEQDPRGRRDRRPRALRGDSRPATVNRQRRGRGRRRERRCAAPLSRRQVTRAPRRPAARTTGRSPSTIGEPASKVTVRVAARDSR